MKIRKTSIQGKQTNIYIYENRKEEFTLVAIPDLDWSNKLKYEETRQEINQKLEGSLSRVLQEEIEELTSRIYQWTREM